MLWCACWRAEQQGGGGPPARLLAAAPLLLPGPCGVRTCPPLPPQLLRRHAHTPAGCRMIRFMDWQRTNNAQMQRAGERALERHTFWSTDRCVHVHDMCMTCA